MENIVDLNLGVKERAIAIAHVLNLRGLNLGEHYTLQTSAFYNGRECSIALTLTKWSKGITPNRVIVFGECRGSDSSFVDTFESSSDIPTIEDFTDKAYKNRKTFNSVEEAANYVYSLLKGYVEYFGY